MKFDDTFIAKTVLGIPTVVLWGDDLPTRRVRFSIGGSILTDQLGVESPVKDQAVLKRCEEEREKIEVACRRAFERHPADDVSLTDADFEEPFDH